LEFSSLSTISSSGWIFQCAWQQAGRQLVHVLRKPIAGRHFGSCLGAVLISQQTLLNWNKLFLVHADGVASCKQDLLDLQDEGQIQVLELFEA